MQMNAQKRAVLYVRVSTKEQVDEGNSLNTQEKHCREYALKNGYEVAEVFVEQGESAKTSMRTELQRMLLYCSDKKNKVNAVISYKIDRLSRNTDDYSQLRILLKRYGVEIKSVTEYFENTPAGRFMENIISNVAQFDNDVRAERCAGGMKDAMREGRYVWMARFNRSYRACGSREDRSRSGAKALQDTRFRAIGRGI
jgi:site-specific DNA recombinase